MNKPTPLTTAPVTFDPIEHRYYRLSDGKELQGITGILSRRLFRDKYAGVPASILNAAAQRGSDIHDACQQAVMFGFDTNTAIPEVVAYWYLLANAGVKPLDTEYIVSDGIYYASPIDMVDEGLNLYDIKTTYTLDTEYVKWQLSIYAYLFELQNPHLTAGRLYGVHLRGDKARLVEVERIPVEVISQLLQADVQDIEFTIPATTDVAVQVPADVARLADLESAIIALKAEMKSYEDRKAEVMNTLYEQMTGSGVSKWETDRITLTAVAPTESTTFDSKAFKVDDPATYEKYVKKTPKKGYLKITIKK